jgi:hypothetical protein
VQTPTALYFSTFSTEFVDVAKLGIRPKGFADYPIGEREEEMGQVALQFFLYPFRLADDTLQVVEVQLLLNVRYPRMLVVAFLATHLVQKVVDIRYLMDGIVEALDAV